MGDCIEIQQSTYERLGGSGSLPRKEGTAQVIVAACY